MDDSVRSEILSLPVSERLRLIEDLWDSIAADPESLGVTPEQRTELDFRLANMTRDPHAVDTWENVKRRILQPK